MASVPHAHMHALRAREHSATQCKDDWFLNHGGQRDSHIVLLHPRSQARVPHGVCVCAQCAQWGHSVHSAQMCMPVVGAGCRSGK